MDYFPTEEQEMIIDTVRTFVQRELVPHEDEVEQLDDVPSELVEEIRQKALKAGIYAANMPEELGGGGLDNLTMAMVDRAFGWTQYALHYVVARPSNILQACTGTQVEEYLLPTIRGERVDCLAMSEPDAGSDVRGMACRAVRDGDDYVISGTKHFISHADLADYTILFASTGEEESQRGPRKLITAFLMDHDTPGLEVVPGYRCVSNRGYHNMILNFDEARVPASKVLGEENRGFEVANEWLGATRLQVAAIALGRADRALSVALEWAATREQFGQKIGKFQGVSFKLADMKTQLLEAELVTYRAAWLMDRGEMVDADAAMAKISATEMLQFVSDEAIQILGGMGLMDELPLERIWRDARVDRIWDGTSEIQRHIISRGMLRPLGA
ncbi:MAG: acyl-CoA dehydrogenase family protein [Acidimicrobiales bacterium]|jgi:acyl-CoA dehydrogenase|nr:acyl-CoA dehydrogenase [Acidimicrobiaceae bacterium]MDP7258579.1 acyl-CoA dehydrogenase family protein [Acidimicrobiales bacterium]HJO80612.1 acyl-CoA dehydrogenase family protein [Acidimicrobiales bacterium]|tara:strand:- start:1702 stop:2862 length:1161 start_codon:yes stop_codon:yes gene_type:complete